MLIRMSPIVIASTHNVIADCITESDT